MRIPHSPYYVYILQCIDGTYYTGKTYNLEKRIKQHNGLLSGGAKYTASRQPARLLYQEVCINNKEACARETQIKNLTRKQKEVLMHICS